mgnify:CR=1 FL=1
MKQHIFLASPHMSEEGYEKEFVKEAFDTNWVAPLGKNVTEFENEMIAKLGAKSAVALASGTAAIHLALKTAGVEQGDFVFCQSLTFSATANPIVYEKAVPVFIDSDESTWNMSPIALQKAFDKYEKLGKLPKAVIVVHLYGICAHIEEIAEICKKYNVPLIEDAAESLGTAYKGKYTGTFGDYGIISFNGNKIITTSGGGMLLFNTADAKERAAKALFWATQARDAARWYQHSEIGYNYRMSNVVAGIGRGQLKVLDQRIEKKRYIYEYYKKHLGRLKGVSLMPQGEEERSNCWLTAIQLSDDCKVKPIDIMLTLEEDDVESRPVWKPLHLQPFFGECDFISDVQELYITDEEMGADNSIAGSIFRKGVCMPSDSKMTDEDLERICGIVKELWV